MPPKGLPRDWQLQGVRNEPPRNHFRRSFGNAADRGKQVKTAREILNSTETEAAFQVRVVALAERLGWMVFHPYDSRRSEPGWPDLALVRGDTLILLELKRESGSLTSPQVAWLTALQRVTRVEAFMARPSHWEKIEMLLQNMGKLDENGYNVGVPATVERPGT
jgi:hypothetical protein